MPIKIKTVRELKGRDCTPGIKMFYYAFKAGWEALVTLPIFSLLIYMWKFCVGPEISTV